jgi:uncharacterized protein YjbI with pentapeptide repeats
MHLGYEKNATKESIHLNIGNFKELDLCGFNFRGFNLSMANFSNANLYGADLRDTELKKTDFLVAYQSKRPEPKLRKLSVANVMRRL